MLAPVMTAMKEAAGNTVTSVTVICVAPLVIPPFRVVRGLYAFALGIVCWVINQDLLTPDPSA